MAQYADKIAAQFVNLERTNRHASLYVGGFRPDPSYIGNVDTTGPGRALYSFGPHFPLCIEDGPAYWVNSDNYRPSQADRYAAGWGPAVRSPKFSPTTAGHARSVTDALTKAGYAPTDRTQVITTENTSGYPTPYTFVLWSKEEN